METSTANQIFEALRKFINEKPEIDPREYGLDPNGRQAYRADYSTIQRDGTKARKALREAQQYPFNAAIMAEAFGRAFSGRLSWTGTELEYTAGQYYPMEYRAAALAVLERYISEVKPKFNPPAGRVYYSSSDIATDAERAGSHFFDRSSKRFFRSRILPDAFHGNGGCYFVTSEQFESSQGVRAQRGYTVRKFKPEDGDVSSFGPFNVLSRSQALKAARIASEYPEAALEYLSQFKESWAR